MNIEHNAILHISMVDWNLKGMEEFAEHEIEHLKRMVSDGTIVLNSGCFGWAFWPNSNQGYYDSDLLRKTARFLEIQNAPLWEEYEEWCDSLSEREEAGEIE